MTGYERGGATALAEAVVPPHVLDECIEGWGMDLLAYLLGAGADAPLAEWRLSMALDDHATRTRLLAVHDLLELFGDDRAVRAWVRDLRPELGSQSPAALIRRGEDPQRVREAAERFLEKA